jgi:hypothetical protein
MHDNSSLLLLKMGFLQISHGLDSSIGWSDNNPVRAGMHGGYHSATGELGHAGAHFGRIGNWFG